MFECDLHAFVPSIFPYTELQEVMSAGILLKEWFLSDVGPHVRCKCRDLGALSSSLFENALRHIMAREACPRPFLKKRKSFIMAI